MSGEPRLTTTWGHCVLFLCILAAGWLFSYFWGAHSSSNQQEQPLAPPLEANGNSINRVEFITAQANASWTPNPEPGITGYELSYAAPPLAAQTIRTAVTNVTVGNLQPLTHYDFKVRAFFPGDIPSPYSSVVPYTTQGLASPFPDISVAPTAPTSRATPINGIRQR